MTRVLLFGTHPHCYNGYCVVVYNLAKQLSLYPDEIELTIFGFQNFYSNPDHIKERALPMNVFVYDANANENPRQMGFGFDQVTEFVTLNKPDVCVIYNDMVVVSNVMDKLKAVPNKSFKIIVYIDQVYLYQKADYVKRLNEEADYVLCFTPYWESIAKGFGITKPTGFLQHGFDPMKHFPVPKKLARQFFSLKEDDFVILNLNRNQPRKRWDTCLQAFAEVVSKHIEDPIKLLIATAMNGAWNLMEVYERELKKRGLTLQEGMKHLIILDNPQQLSDDDINILYNLADIGINTCDGEGFGLCNFEQAAVGVPQVVPKIGGFLDFFTSERALMIEPKITFYIDSSRDGVGGEAQMCHWQDIADAIELYYADPDMRKKHGDLCREYILKNYRWEDLGRKFKDILLEVHGEKDKKKASMTNLMNISLDNIRNLNIKEIQAEKKLIPIVIEDEHENDGIPKVEEVSPALDKASQETVDQDIVSKDKAEQSKKKLGKKKKNKGGNTINKKELIALKNKLDKLLSNI